MKLKTNDKKAEPTQVESRYAKVQELRKYHQATLDAYGRPDADFIPKMAYIPKGKEELCIGFFPSEMQRGVDFFTEFVDKNLQPEDPERKLYLWKYNQFWETEYEQINNGTYTWAMVPVSELYIVDLSASMKVTNDFDLTATENVIKAVSSEFNDAPISELTIKDLAAILLNKPCSDKPFLNKLILS